MLLKMSYFSLKSCKIT